MLPWPKLTPLHLCVLRDDQLEQVAQTCRETPDAKCTDIWSRTALHICAEKSTVDPNLADLLLRHIPVDIPDSKGRTAAHLVAKYDGCPRFLQTLIARGADINFAPQLDETVLASGIQGASKKEIFSVLFIGGADLGKAEVEFARTLGRSDLVELFNIFRSMILLCATNNSKTKTVFDLPEDLLRLMQKALV